MRWKCLSLSEVKLEMFDGTFHTAASPWEAHNDLNYIIMIIRTFFQYLHLDKTDVCVFCMQKSQVLLITQI